MTETIPFRDTWTEADLADLPDDGHRYELIDGRLYVTPPAGEEHQDTGGGLFTTLRNAAPAGWRVLYEIGLAIDDDRFVPDLVVLPPGTPMASKRYNDVNVIKPALVVEIASPSTQTTDLGDKMIAYARGRIPAYWRIERDSTMHLHVLHDKGVYLTPTVIRPGESHVVLWPFEVELVPAQLRSAS